MKKKIKQIFSRTVAINGRMKLMRSGLYRYQIKLHGRWCTWPNEDSLVRFLKERGFKGSLKLSITDY